MTSRSAVALDLGSSAGRAVLGTLTDGVLTLSEEHRFAHEAAPDPSQGGALAWDLDLLLAGIRHGIGRAGSRAAEGGAPLGSVGVDTWGVDYALLRDDSSLLRAPRAYRDGRMARHLPEFTARIAPGRLWSQTGAQPVDFLTAAQVFADLAEEPRLADRVDTLALMPDYLGHLLGGRLGAGRSIASTTGLAAPGTTTWADDVLGALGIPAAWFGAIEGEPRVIGPLRPDGVSGPGLAEVQVVRPGGHDTACAVHALGLGIDDVRLFISCGSWTLVGATTPEPVLTQAAYEACVTNETRTDGGTRLLRNLTGLWILQECQRDWAAAGHPHTIGAVMAAAEDADSVGVVIDPADEAFMRPGRMPDKLAAVCSRVYGSTPDGIGQTTRLIIESLACAHAETVATLSSLLPHRPADDLPIHVIGGGSRNALLMQATADACGRPVLAGPAEASAVGNLLAQFEATGALDPAARADVVRRSFAPVRFDPAGRGAHYARLAERLAHARRHPTPQPHPSPHQGPARLT